MTIKANILISIILFSFLSFFIYQDTKINISNPSEKNYAIQKGIHSIGYESGKKVFDIKISAMMQKSYRHILYTDELIDGKIFNENEDAIIQNLKGSKGRVNTHIKSILVTGNISATIHPTTSTKSIDINANGFRYNHQKNKSTFFDGIRLTVDNKQLTASLLDYYSNSEKAFFPEMLTISSENSISKLSKATLNIKDSLIIASNNIETIYKKKASKTDSDQVKSLLKSITTITAKNMNLNFSDNQYTIVDYNTNVLVTQPDKTLNAEQIIINFKDDIYEAKKNAKLQFESLNWSLNKHRKIKNKEIKKMLSKKTIIESEHIKFKPNKNIIEFNENVVAKQTNFKLTCKQLTYDISKELVHLTGDVKIYKFGVEYLKSNKIIIDIKNERFSTESKSNLSEIMLEI